MRNSVTVVFAADALVHAASIVLRRGHHPAGIAEQDGPFADIHWLWRCPLSGIAALYATADGERALPDRPRQVPQYVDDAIEAWSAHLRADGAAPVFDADGFVDHAATVSAWEAAATGAQVAESLRAAARTLTIRAEGSREADVTALEGAAA